MNDDHATVIEYDLRTLSISLFIMALTVAGALVMAYSFGYSEGHMAGRKSVQNQTVIPIDEIQLIIPGGD